MLGGVMRCYLAFIMSAVSLAGAGTGKLTGTVVDDHGIPEKHLAIEACPLDTGVQGACPQAETDGDGHFAMSLVVGRNDDGTTYGLRWAVHPLFEPGGGGYYPPARVPFYKTENKHPNFQEVDITPEAPNATVEVRLGPRAGALTGRVTDAVTGAPIKPYATIVVAWVSDPKTIMGANSELAGEIDSKTGQWKYHGAIEGKYRMLVPADTELTLKATTIAKGYKPYQYSGVITVGSGQDKVLDIQLQPEDK
jgi:hypothetical protein